MKKILKYLRKIIPHNSPLRLWYTRSLQYYTFKTDQIDLGDMQLIGVTGTDGKTTAVEMIAHILDELSVPYLSTSSLEAKINGTVLSASKRTTPSLSALHTLLKQAKKSDIKVVVIEVSSHALVQWRVLGIKFDTAVLTNITHEHLNFHKTIAEYANAKKLLFTKHFKTRGTLVLPTNDDYGKKWLKELTDTPPLYSNQLPYSPENANAITDKYGTAFIYNGAQYQIPMLGAYNAGNAIAAALAVGSLKLSKSTTPNVTITTEDALLALGNFDGIPGRMQIVPNDNITCIVDFALTAKAMSSALATAREVSQGGKVIVAFGASGGQHDTTVHPGLAKAAAEGADVCIVTDDEPYDGDPAEIRANLIKHIEKTIQIKIKKLGTQGTDQSFATKFEYYNIADRREALQKAIELSNDGDVVIATGMGHYTSRTVDGKEVPWNDSEVLKDLILNTTK